MSIYTTITDCVEAAIEQARIKHRQRPSLDRLKVGEGLVLVDGPAPRYEPALYTDPLNNLDMWLMMAFPEVLR